MAQSYVVEVQLVLQHCTKGKVVGALGGREGGIDVGNHALFDELVYNEGGVGDGLGSFQSEIGDLAARCCLG